MEEYDKVIRQDKRVLVNQRKGKWIMLRKSLKNIRIEEVKKLVKKAKMVVVWSNWHKDDGSYFKVEKGYFLQVLKEYEDKLTIEFDYRYDYEDGILYFN